ncbi:3-deoxy-D-manno-octulosonic acid transferase [Candidatus Bodocaedibacter vickermanii]|uniref:3-deoxy-D-manno-octulosonic acid transferase n=1 Tax=Candidatus Bodocaedibacter vickermanii TaxID=2741701 RepID=A0A7L9RUT8_9PROT|nr:3-deoxy-D-manno-octulosonic acid transferase [Candidatus Paracaedibacteraceae bacterium 'Lake Konstanz']
MTLANYKITLSTSSGESITLDDSALLVFIDETGCEDLKDPKNPSFGRAGCAILSRHYNKSLRNPWLDMKKEFFGGMNVPWHTADINFTEPRINAVNKFVDKPFVRFGAICTNKTDIDEKYSVHETISETFILQTIPNLIEKFKRISRICFIFESSKRLNTLVEAEFNPHRIRRHIDKKYNFSMPIDCFFLTKTLNEPGLEVADLLAHTLGRQNKNHMIQGKSDFTPDFKKTFHNQHSIGGCMFIESIKTNQSFLEQKNHKTPRNSKCPCGSGKKYKKCCRN